MLILDHLAVACTSLAEGTAWVEDQLGATLQPGGRHPRYGTHNRLLGLANGLYLEVIAKDPGAASEAGHAWFGLDAFTGPPRLANWICRTGDMSGALARAPKAVGTPRALTRGDLAWQITVPGNGSLPYQGAYPTLIQWTKGTYHPAESLPASGCRLLRLEVCHPEATDIMDMMELADSRVQMMTGAFGLKAIFETPGGIRSLS